MSENRTGYEQEFDFPEREVAPSLTYLLATVPRTGSTYLSHRLWGSGCLGAPLEYLNFDPAGPYGSASNNPDRQRSLWRAAILRRTSPNGVFGVKGFPVQFAALQSTNPPLLAEVMRAIFPSRAASRVIRLHRRDRTAHAISYARAILSGVWRKEQEDPSAGEVDYSALAVERAMRLIDEAEETWDQMLADLRITPLELWYEDVVANPNATRATVARYLGVPIDPGSAVEVPVIGRQEQKGAQDWTRKHTGNQS